MLAMIARRIRRLLARRGVAIDDSDGDTDPWMEEAPVLAGLTGASVQGRVALGPRAGREVRRAGASAELLALAPSVLGPCHARRHGFDLHAGVVVPGNDRARLERVCRYAPRPPVAHDRIHRTGDGQMMVELRHRWAAAAARASGACACRRSPGAERRRGQIRDTDGRGPTGLQSAVGGVDATELRL